MDPFRLCLALGPVAIYLLLLSAINLSRRPLLVSGTGDTAVLGVAVSGLVLVGPMDLLLPVPTVLRFGAYVWALLIPLYAFGLVLILLIQRPRLVVYNLTPSELRPILADVATRLDSEARWAGDCLLLPTLRVQLHLDSFSALRNVALVAVGPNQSYSGWRRLELALRAALEQYEVPRNLRALTLAAAGTGILFLLGFAIAHDPQAVAQAMFEMLRL